MSNITPGRVRKVPTKCHLLFEWPLLSTEKKIICLLLLESYNPKMHITYLIVLVCPMSGFKKQGTFYFDTEFIANTFELEDIFADSFVEVLKNSSQFFIKTIHSILHGRCYALFNQQKIPVFEVDNYIKLKRDFDIILYIHTYGNIIK